MIEIQYLGQLRQDLDLELEQEELEWQSSITDVASLIEHLCNERGSEWSTALHQEKLLVSVNNRMVKTDCQLGDGDEVIFFPPIAGG